jgi:hypothetical protein
MKFVVILALLFTPVSTRADEYPNHFVLLSYCIADGVYRFPLVSLADFNAISEHTSGHYREFTGAGYCRNVSELKRAMMRVPEGAVIEWRGWKPADTCYPPKPVIDDICAFARSRHIDVRLPEYKSTE